MHFYDVDTDEDFWVSGPKRDQTDARFGAGRPTIEEDARAPYEAFIDGALCLDVGGVSTPSARRSRMLRHRVRVQPCCWMARAAFSS